MSRAALFGAFVVVTAGLSGCASPAKVVRHDPTTVVVAIPEQTNTWPFYYQDEAKKLAAGLIQDPVLVGSVPKKIGESTTTTQDASRRDIGTGKDKVGELTSASSTTSVSDSFEYHLEYQSRPRITSPVNPPADKSAGAPPLPPPPGVSPIVPASGTMPLTPNREFTSASDLKLPPPPATSPATNLPNMTPPGR